MFHYDADVSMADNVPDDVRGDAEIKQQRDRGMAQVMEADVVEPEPPGCCPSLFLAGARRPERVDLRQRAEATPLLRCGMITALAGLGPG